MSDAKREVPWVCVSPDFVENRNKFTYEELVRYAGQHVAWSLDGTRVLAHGPTAQEAWVSLVAAGGNPEQVVWDAFPTEEEWSWANL